MTHIRHAARPAELPWQAVRKAADSKLSRFERTITAAVRAGQDAIDGAALQAAFQDRNERWLDSVLGVGLAVTYANLRRWLPEAVQGTMAAGAEAAARDARAWGRFRFAVAVEGVRRRYDQRSAGLRVARDRRFDDLHFDLVNPESVTWAQLRSATLITNISGETRAAIRTIIARCFSEGITAEQAARLIRPLIGLTDAHAAAVLNLRLKILANPGKKLWAGSMPVRVPRGGATWDFLIRRAEQYATRLLNYRARAIARTETIAAANEGQLLLWKQAVTRGLLRGTEVKEWIVTPDDRLCPICEAIPKDGPVPIDMAFPSVGVQGPPAHALCRCSMGLSRKRVRISIPGVAA